MSEPSSSTFAALYDRLIGPLERLWLARRRAALVGQVSGRVLEVGVGTGLTLPHYRAAREIVGVDPNRTMLARASARAAEAMVPVSLVEGRAEALPFEDASFDAAVVSLVLCSVGDPETAARELRRVLVAGGEVRVLEHVRATGRAVARLQDLVTPAWRRMFGNCHPNRDTARVLEAAGFDVGGLARRLHGLVIIGTARAPGRSGDGPVDARRTGEEEA